MVAVAEIKEKLPNWPDAIIQDWLLYFANDIGWPPPEPFGDSRWGAIMGGRPLSWWVEVSWGQETVDCSRAGLSSTTQHRIGVTSDPIYSGTANEQEKGQYRRPLQFLLEHGIFANPPLAMRVDGRLHFVDGLHRLAAFIDLREKASDAFFAQPGRQRPAAQQAVWIGIHVNGEVPLT